MPSLPEPSKTSAAVTNLDVSLSLRRETHWNMLTVQGREGIKVTPVPEQLLENERRFRDAEDPFNINPQILGDMINRGHYIGEARLLAVQRVVTYRGTTIIDGEALEFRSAPSSSQGSKLYWLGGRFQLAEQAESQSYAGQTALKWAKSTAASLGQDPETIERVVQARNGYFYPAGLNDESITVN